MNNAAINISRAEVASGIPKRQLFVVEAQQMQDRCVKVVHMNFAFHRQPANLVRAPPAESRADSSAGKEYGKAFGIVVASV